MSEDEFSPFVDDDDDLVLVRFVPKKNNKWIFPLIGVEFIRDVSQAFTTAMTNLTTHFSQRFMYQEDRDRWSADTGYDIEHVDDFLKEVENDCADAE